jgi:hypothetical protein
LEGESKGTIYIPVTDKESQLDSLTIEIAHVGEGPLVVKPIKTDENSYAPKKVIIKASNYTPAATKENQNPTMEDVTLTINLPKSAVTLDKLEDAGVTLATVTSTTAPNVLRLRSGVTISAITVSAGNVLVQKGATITAVTSGTFYKFDDTATEVSTESNVTTAPVSIYHLLFPANGDKITLPTNGFTVTGQAIEIGKGDKVEIDLNGKTLKANTAINVIKVSGEGAQLTIKDTNDTETPGEITSDQTGNATILVEEGGKVILEKGKLANTGASGTVVSLTGKNSKIEVTGGTIVGGTGTPVAIAADKEAAVELNGATVDVTGNVAITGAGSLTLKDGKITGNVTATGVTTEDAEQQSVITVEGGSITTKSGVAIDAKSNSEVNIKGGTITGNNNALSLKASEAKIEGAPQVTSKLRSAILVDDSELTIEGTPTISTNDATKVYAAIEDKTASTININGGTYSSKSAAAIKLIAGSVANITDGTFTGATNAVSVTKGTLNVTGENAPSFTAPTTISAVPATDVTKEEVVVTLQAQKAVYKSTETYVIYNASGTETKATKATLSIEGGYFTGDVISDQSTYFIKGGYFQNCNNLENHIEYISTTKKLSNSQENGFWTIGDRTI